MSRFAFVLLALVATVSAQTQIVSGQAFSLAAGVSISVNQSTLSIFENAQYEPTSIAFTQGRVSTGAAADTTLTGFNTTNGFPAVLLAFVTNAFPSAASTTTAGFTVTQSAGYPFSFVGNAVTAPASATFTLNLTGSALLTGIGSNQLVMVSTGPDALLTTTTDYAITNPVIANNQYSYSLTYGRSYTFVLTTAANLASVLSQYSSIGVAGSSIPVSHAHYNQQTSINGNYGALFSYYQTNSSGLAFTDAVAISSSNLGQVGVSVNAIATSDIPANAAYTPYTYTISATATSLAAGSSLLYIAPASFAGANTLNAGSFSWYYRAGTTGALTKATSSSTIQTVQGQNILLVQTTSFTGNINGQWFVYNATASSNTQSSSGSSNNGNPTSNNSGNTGTGTTGSASIAAAAFGLIAAVALLF